MTIEEIRERFDSLESEVTEVTQQIEKDAHLEFIESLRQFVNKY